jgi:hypothetical protein
MYYPHPVENFPVENSRNTSILTVQNEKPTLSVRKIGSDKIEGYFFLCGPSLFNLLMRMASLTSARHFFYMNYRLFVLIFRIDRSVKRGAYQP